VNGADECAAVPVGNTSLRAPLGGVGGESGFKQIL